jgi:dihydroneopterin aldolase
MDSVFIKGLRVETVIGIHDWEREIRQVVVLDLEMAADTRLGAQTDAIEQALDYAAVSARLIEYVGACEFQLLETLAEEVARIVREEFGVPWLRLVLAKPGAVPEADTVGVVIERGNRL